MPRHATTGYYRKYVMHLLNHTKEVQLVPQHPRRHRDAIRSQDALFLVWHAANRICAKRLIPFLPTLFEALEGHEHLHLDSGMSRPTPLHEREPWQITSSALNASMVDVASQASGRESGLKQQIPSEHLRGVE
jgi:hypothetical protein